LAFSADRLFGLYYTTRDLDIDQFDYLDDDGVEFGLMWQGPGRTPYTLPRMSIDYFVIDHLSIGGTIGAFMTDGDGPTTSGFFFGPRVGGAFMLADWAGIWPRGGIQYYRGNNFLLGSDTWQLVFNAECAFVLSPAENWAFTLGPAFDIGLAGEWDPDGPAHPDLSSHGFGLVTAGIMGYINL
jgi:hypothetical protein